MPSFRKCQCLCYLTRLFCSLTTNLQSPYQEKEEEEEKKILNNDNNNDNNKSLLCGTRKSETELTASDVRKDQIHTKVKQNAF